MSIEPGGKVPNGLLRDAQQRMLDAAEDEVQLELIDPISPEEMADAQAELGPDAGPLTVLRAARERRRGRPKGSANRRNADTVSYLLQFGPDPLRAAMAIINTPPEVLIERSYALDPVKKRMSYSEALSLQIRCMEMVAPYLHGKQPVRVDATIRGVIVQEQIGQIMPGGTIINGEPLGVLGAPMVEGDDRHDA